MPTITGRPGLAPLGEFATDTETAAAVEAHRADTSTVHGITNTASVVTDIREWGAVPTGTNDTTTVNTALAAFDAAGGGTLRIPAEVGWVFTGSTGLALTGTSNPIHLLCDPGTVFDMTGSTASIGLTLGGSMGSGTALGADVARGAVTITCGLAVSPGDIVKIESSAEWVEGSPKGELAEVLLDNGATITLKAGLWDSYAAATTTVSLMEAPRVSVQGLTITRNSNHTGLLVQYARDVVLRDVYAEGARATLMSVSNVYGATVEACGGRDFWYSGTGTSYGLSVASSQHVREIGNDFRGGRHGVAHGGTFPCRDVQVIGGTFDSYEPSGRAAVDFHENVENAKVTGATILNGLVSGAVNLDVSGCTIRTSNGSASPEALTVLVYRDGEYITLRDNDIEACRTNIDAVNISSACGSTTTTLDRVTVTGRVVGNGTAAGIRVIPDTTSDTGLTVGRLEIGGDVSGGVGIYLQRTSSAEVTVTDTVITGAVNGADNTAILVTNTGGERLTISNANVTTSDPTTAYCLNAAASTMNITISGSRMACVGVTGYRMELGTGTLVQVLDSTLEGFGTNGGINAASATAAVVTNVNSVNCTGSHALP